MMTELRWLEKRIGKKHDAHDNTSFNDDTVKVLQYRQQIDTTIYAGYGLAPRLTPSVHWSDWTDVPTVHEDFA